MTWVCAMCGHISGAEHAPDCRHYYTKTPQPSPDPRLATAAASTPGRMHTDPSGVSGRETGGES